MTSEEAGVDKTCCRMGVTIRSKISNSSPVGSRVRLLQGCSEPIDPLELSSSSRKESRLERRRSTSLASLPDLIFHLHSSKPCKTSFLGISLFLRKRFGSVKVNPRTIVLSPKQYLTLTVAQKSQIVKTRIVPPKLGGEDFGSIEVEFKRPVRIIFST